MLTIANKGRYVVKKGQKHVYVICEGFLNSFFLLTYLVARRATSHLVPSTFSPWTFGPPQLYPIKKVPDHLVPMDKWSPRQLVPQTC